MDPIVASFIGMVLFGCATSGPQTEPRAELSGVFLRQNFLNFGPRAPIASFLFFADGNVCRGLPKGGLRNDSGAMCSQQKAHDRGRYRISGKEIEFTWSDGTKEQQSFRRTGDGIEIGDTKYLSTQPTDGMTIEGKFTAVKTMLGFLGQTEMTFTKSGEVSVNGSWAVQDVGVTKRPAGGSRTRGGKYRVADGTLEIHYGDGASETFSIVRLPNDPTLLLLDGYPYVRM